MTAVLGINAFRRDPAAALVVDGVPVAAIQEERLTRQAGEEGFPTRAVRWCLERGGLAAQDLDAIVVAEKPLRRFERVLATQLHGFPGGAKPFAKSMFLWLGDRLWMRGRIASELEVSGSMVKFVEHARAHVASAAAFADDERVAALILDDVGEWASTTLARVDGAEIEIVAEQRYPHSLGLVASALTQFLGLTPGVDEPALDRLGAAGQPRYLDALRRFVAVDAEGVLQVDLDAFPFPSATPELFGPGLEKALGARREPGRTPSFEDQGATDIAASACALLGECAVLMAQRVAATVPANTLVVAGLVARMPSVMEWLRAEGPYATVVVPPWPDEAGAALGAALVGAASRARGVSSYLGPGLGPGLGSDRSQQFEGGGALELAVAAAIERVVAGELVGWAAGRLAFGCSSLGGRVAFVDPRDPADPGAVASTGPRARLMSALQRPEDWQATWLAASPSSLQATQRGNLPLLTPSPDDPSGLGALVAAATKAGLPGLLVADLRVRGGVLPRAELEVLETFQRTGLDALVTETSLYLNAASPALA